MPGLALPSYTQPATPAPVSATGAPPSPSFSVGGIMPVMGPDALRKQMADESARLTAAVEAMQSSQVIQSLAGHIKKFFSRASEARQTAENEMIEAMYCRRGEYTADRLQRIAQNKQPAIYMMLGASKMRQVESLLRDVLLGSGSDKPWTLRPSRSPELPPFLVNQIVQALEQEIVQAQQMGVFPTLEAARQRARAMKDQANAEIDHEAQVRCARMERKMEDQLSEGGFIQAFDSFIADLSTFKTAFLKGPVVRKRPKLSWGENGEMTVIEALQLGWERVDPLNMYPAPWARDITDGPLIERHRLTREALSQMIGVEGYSEDAIRKVLDLYGESGYSSWMSVDSAREDAEGKGGAAGSGHADGLIDALQYWGSASGKMLTDWGLKSDKTLDPAKEYQIEAWLVGDYVIKAVLNSDPLARRPYYCDSFSRIPGSVWGNSPYDLLKDCQDMCNGAARALAANMAISSGPQVAVMSNRLASGEDITDMYPWKIWQFQDDPMGGQGAPISFFQPGSNANELMSVYERFSLMADEYTGIPRYMAGFNGGEGGAGRTASGMSMMIGNATKIIKQLVASIDTHVVSPLLERQYYYNMRYSDDPDLKGDVQVVARGALSMQVKEAAQQRRNEFLQATANPIDMQIIGMEGRAEVLRAAAGSLDLNTDRVVPPIEVLKQRLAMQQAMMAAQAMPGAQPQQDRPSGEVLENGEPVTDRFAPAAA